MQVVRIKSFDMSYNTGTWDKDTIKNFGLVDLDIIGWLIEDREDCVVIASEYQPTEDTYRHLIAVPKVCIKEIKKLRKN